MRSLCSFPATALANSKRRAGDSGRRADPRPQGFGRPRPQGRGARRRPSDARGRARRAGDLRAGQRARHGGRSPISPRCPAAPTARRGPMRVGRRPPEGRRLARRARGAGPRPADRLGRRHRHRDGDRKGPVRAQGLRARPPAPRGPHVGSPRTSLASPDRCRTPDASGFDSPFRLARDLCLIAAKASGVAAINTVYTRIDDLEGLSREAAAARRDGFDAQGRDDRKHVEAVNAAFAPTEAEIAWARRVVEAFAADRGAGVVKIEGKMVDKPHLKAAEANSRLRLAAERLEPSASPPERSPRARRDGLRSDPRMRGSAKSAAREQGARLNERRLVSDRCEADDGEARGRGRADAGRRIPRRRPSARAQRP